MHKQKIFLCFQAVCFIMNSMQGCIEVNMQQMVQHFNFLKYRTGSCFFGMKNAVFVFLSNYAKA